MLITISEIQMVVDQDGEHADWANPNGYIYGSRFYLSFATEEGEVWGHFKLYESLEEAYALQEKVRKHLDNGGSLNMEHWRFDRYVYGSKAWEMYGEAEQIEFEKQNRY